MFAIRTTIGQEKNTAEMINSRIESRDLPIKALLVPQDIRGYIFIEADGKSAVERARSGVKHAKGLIERKVSLKEIEELMEPKPTISGMEKGDIVELTGGPFKGERGRIIRIEDTKEEATIELFEATVPIPVTVRGDRVRVVERKREEEE
ncbi:transcription antiterminator NusG [candidate division MSBL1 archaeon SCGC-AAA382A03]|uniref:Transcription elongation factor Spt5 n=1 Tax=candidate division MSBL1 archaeon SCGC-AAA382A03 TaxID=1698278 RepID=A0A133VF06_9EURY|nr:transcription antiterminator NusG [candidate division MSBL1 archaeon SCGC-AAA382A03]